METRRWNECPACGTVCDPATAQPLYPARPFGPGEWAVFVCEGCGEPFVSAGDYSNYKELVDGRAAKYEDRYKPYAYADSADFNVRSFRNTNVLRWEYKPGSALFLVWQQGKSDSDGQGDFRFGRDFRGVFNAPSHNVFLVKFSYWLNM